jgi:multiple sugar transport system permease protein
MQTYKKIRVSIRSIIKYLTVIILVAILLFPIYWMVVSSVTPSNFLMSLPPHLLPIKTTLINYSKIFARPQYVRFFINSFVVSGGTVLLVLVISIPASYSFSRFNFAFKNAIMTSIMSVQMFPIVVILISLYTFYLQWGLINTYRGLILADAVFALPLAIMLMKSFFDTLPKSLDESARIDGAGRFQTLFRVLLPLTLPGIIAVGIYTFLSSWDDFLMALTIMTTDTMKTLPVGLAQSFMGEYAHDYGGLMAFSVAGSLPIVLMFIFFQRYMIEGLTAGAVKG